MTARDPKTLRRGTERKPDFLPLIADAFVDKGYRRTTTAELAARCAVRENELYRIWPNKKAMFLESIGYVFDVSARQWAEGIDTDSPLTAAEQLIHSQSRKRGDTRLHRIVFSGLSEVDDPEIRNALKQLYLKFHEVLAGYVRDHRQRRNIHSPLSDDATAWVMIGLGSIFDIQHDLGQGTMKQRREVLGEATTAILNMTE